MRQDRATKALSYLADVIVNAVPYTLALLLPSILLSWWAGNKVGALAARRLTAPEVTPMGRDERVEHDGYADQRPTDVGRQLRDAAQLFANVLERLKDEDWERTLIFPYPEPEERTLRWLALHTLHELRHHLLDMHRQLDS